MAIAIMRNFTIIYKRHSKHSLYLNIVSFKFASNLQLLFSCLLYQKAFTNYNRIDYLDEYYKIFYSK